MSSTPEETVTANPSSPADADAAFGHLVNVLNSGMLALMISVGDRTGLFGTMRSMTASTSAQIAAAAGLNERYVREWLAAMTAGGIVAHDPVIEDVRTAIVLRRSTVKRPRGRFIGGRNVS